MDKILNMFRPPGTMWALIAALVVTMIGALALMLSPQTCYAFGSAVEVQNLGTEYQPSTVKEEQGRICDLIAPTVSGDMCVGRDNNGKNAAPFNCSTNMIAVPTLALRTAATEPVAWQASNLNCGRRTTAHPQIEPETKAS